MRNDQISGVSTRCFSKLISRFSSLILFHKFPSLLEVQFDVRGEGVWLYVWDDLLAGAVLSGLG